MWSQLPLSHDFVPFRPNLQRFLTCTVLWLFFFWFLSGLAASYVMYSFPQGNVLPDLGFRILGDQVWCPQLGLWLPDLVMLTSLLLSLVRIVMFHRHGRHILCRFLLLNTVLLGLRSCCVCITFLNNPNPLCVDCQGRGCPDNMLDAMAQVFSSFPLATCGDLIYSGHTCTNTLMALVWIRYTDNLLVKLLFVAWNSFGIVLLVTCRYHYTIDVILALILTLLFWHLYHLHVFTTPISVARKASIEGSSERAPLSPRASRRRPGLLLRFFLWMEAPTLMLESPQEHWCPSSTPCEECAYRWAAVSLD